MSIKFKMILLAGLFLVSGGLAVYAFYQMNQPKDVLSLRQVGSSSSAAAQDSGAQAASQLPTIEVPSEKKPSAPRSTKAALHEDALPRQYNTGIVFGESLPITRAEDEGEVSITKVSLPADALKWTQGGYRPRMGDIFTVKVKEGLSYEIKIEAMQVDEMGLSVSGVLMGKDVMGSGGIISVGDKMSIRVHDFNQERLYQLAYDFVNNYYTLTEVDQRKIPRGTH